MKWKQFFQQLGSIVPESRIHLALGRGACMCLKRLQGGFWCLVNILFSWSGCSCLFVEFLWKCSQLYTYGLYTFMYFSIKSPQKSKHTNKTIQLLDMNIDKFSYNFRTKSFLMMTQIRSQYRNVSKRKHNKWGQKINIKLENIFATHFLTKG